MHGILAYATLAVIAGLGITLSYTTRTLHKVHASHAALAAAAQAAPLVPPRGKPSRRAPGTGTALPGPTGQAPAVTQHDARQARRPRRAWATWTRLATLVAVTTAACWATGYSHHWPALAGDAAALILSAWLTRRWR